MRFILLFLTASFSKTDKLKRNNLTVWEIYHRNSAHLLEYGKTNCYESKSFSMTSHNNIKMKKNYSRSVYQGVKVSDVQTTVCQ